MSAISSRSIALACARVAISGILGPASMLAQQSNPPPSETSVPAAAQLEPVEVTGSRIKRTDTEGPSPIRIIGQDEMDVAGAIGITDVLREIPESTPLEINEANAVTFARGTSALSFRNLGASNTLLLVDGRRQAPNGISEGGTVFVDPNRIPTAMIERVEVLKDGASAVYGADATAGVVNIITKKNFQGAELTMRYGNYLHTDGAEQTSSFIGGVTRGPLHVDVMLSSASRKANAAIDESFSSNADLTERYRALDPIKYAPYLVPSTVTVSNFDYRSSTGPYAIVSVPSASLLAAAGLPASALVNPLTGKTAVFLPGTGGVPDGILGAAGNPASVPRDNTPPRPAAAQFVTRYYGPGDHSNAYNFQPFMWNVPASRRRGIATRLDCTVTPHISLYGTISYQRNQSTTHLAPTPITSGGDLLVVPPNNYYNPFGVAVAFNYRPLDVGPRISNVTSNSLDLLLGAHGAWRHRFDWDIGLSDSRNATKDESANSISRSKLRVALARTTPDAFNIFGGPGFRNDPATLAFIRIAPVASGNTRTTVADAHLSSTDLFELPWGRIGGAVSGEHRAESFNVTSDPLSSVLNDVVATSPAPNPTRSRRTVDSVAAEVRAPLLPEARYAFARTLELSGAAREEKFSDGYGSGLQPFLGIRYRPIRDLLLRATTGRVFHAPSLPQLYGGYVDFQVTGLPDLRRPVALTNDVDDASTAVRLLRTGGNPKLHPENGRTKQAGLVYDVSRGRLRGLSLEYTYGVIEQSALITNSLGTGFIRRNEIGSTADLVIRAPGTQTFTNTTSTPIPILTGPFNTTTPLLPGQSATVPGKIISILDAAVNLADQIVRYDDYGVSYRFSIPALGHFTLTSNWTYYEYYARRRFTTDRYETSVGRDLPRYRGQSAVAWRQGRWAANLGMNYIHRRGNIVLDQVEVARYTTYSASVSRAVEGNRWLRHTRVALGIENLLNAPPPLFPVNSGYDQRLVARPGGRFVFMTVRRTL